MPNHSLDTGLTFLNAKTNYPDSAVYQQGLLVHNATELVQYLKTNQISAALMAFAGDQSKFLISKLIGWVTNSETTHAGLMIQYKGDYRYCENALKVNARCLTGIKEIQGLWDNYEGAHLGYGGKAVLSPLPSSIMNETALSILNQKIDSLIGSARYSVLDDVRIFLRHSTKQLNPKATFPLLEPTDKEQQCAEFVTLAFKGVVPLKPSAISNAFEPRATITDDPLFNASLRMTLPQNPLLSLLRGTGTPDYLCAQVGGKSKCAAVSNSLISSDTLSTLSRGVCLLMLNSTDNACLILSHTQQHALRLLAQLKQPLALTNSSSAIPLGTNATTDLTFLDELKTRESAGVESTTPYLMMGIAMASMTVLFIGALIHVLSRFKAKKSDTSEPLLAHTPIHAQFLLR